MITSDQVVFIMFATVFALALWTVAWYTAGRKKKK